MTQSATIAVVLAVIGLIALPAVLAGGVRVDPASQAFIDKQGRVRVFHGLNAVYKIEPFYPQLTGFDPLSSLSDVDMANLQKWGMNMIRLGVMWHPVAPEGPGQYNETYLDVMSDLIERMGQYNIWTLVDSHEDCMSRHFCGEGFPDWAVEQLINGTENNILEKFPSPLPIDLGHDGIYPNLTKCQEHFFAEYHFTIETNTAWRSFYREPAIRAAFAGYWKAVAAAFNGSETVIGYELLNEPWPGDLYKEPLWFLENGKQDNENLLPLYKEVYQAIRQADPETVVVYEPNVATGYLDQPFGFSEGPGGPENNDNQAIAYHLYCLSQNSTGDPKNITSCNDRIGKVFDIAMDSVHKIGGGSIISEFGALGPHESSAEAITYLTNLADSQLQSWAYWTFKHFADITTQNSATETLYNADGSLQMEKLKALSRTYAQAIAAKPGSITMNFNADTKEFNLNYLSNGAATDNTVIYLNEDLHYPNGFNASVTPSGIATIVRTKANEVQVAPIGTMPDNVSISVTITAA